MASSSSSSPELSGAAPASAYVHYSDLSRDEVLEDLSSRFILNLPEEELTSVERVCFQVEQAHWYYEDFVREQSPHKFPSYTLKTFSEALFHACPLLAHWASDHDKGFESFMKYKTRVPVCGAIMLNDKWDKCVLVKGWRSSAGWGFPKGKINEQEPKHRCAIREVYEETGYNLEDQLDPQNVISVTIREQSISLYIVPGVPEDFPFETRTRKEISKISWFKLCDLPTWKRGKTAPGKFYLITPFISALRQFIHDRKPRNIPRKLLKNPVPEPKVDIHSSSEEDSVAVNDHSSVGTAQELSSQASSAEPLTPSPQYSAARVHSATFDSTIGSGTPDPAREGASLDTGDSHLASLLSGLQRSAASLALDDTEKPGLHTGPTLPSASQRNAAVAPPTESPDWSAAHAPARPVVNVDRAPQATSSPSMSAQSADETVSAAASSSLSSCASSPTLVAQSSPGHTRRGSAATADISPYLSHTQSITKTMRYHSMLESVAQESDRATSRMSLRPPVAGSHVPHPPLPASSVPPPHVPMLDQSVIYSSSPALQPAMPRAPVRPMYQPQDQDPFMVRPRTSHTHHLPPFAPASVPRQSMNEHQLRALLPLNGPYSGPPRTAFLPSYGPVPTSPLRGVPPQFPPTHFAHNNAMRATNNAQLLSILNTPNPASRA
ncbi:DCP2-domain-containing protein [Polyporus arcularius HHB13444]|uniref:DCP2-domain-containing protein n=1 Tax=Polyporus arcularius HHB13444 TaxID=1314778 RepID=A0A5C3PUK3_9APHY|nr:DCP2-domain-containing protein [Polyporus arcularius HHB13444]